MTTSRNNTIMSWMAYTDFLSRLRIAAGILLPLNTRTLLLYPGGRDCIGAAGVDAYDSLDESPIGYSAERSVDQPPTRLRIYADYKLANQNILLNNYVF